MDVIRCHFCGHSGLGPPSLQSVSNIFLLHLIAFCFSSPNGWNKVRQKAFTLVSQNTCIFYCSTYQICCCNLWFNCLCFLYAKNFRRWGSVAAGPVPDIGQIFSSDASKNEWMISHQSSGPQLINSLFYFPENHSYNALSSLLHAIQDFQVKLLNCSYHPRRIMKK